MTMQGNRVHLLGIPPGEEQWYPKNGARDVVELHHARERAIAAVVATVAQVTGVTSVDAESAKWSSITANECLRLMLTLAKGKTINQCQAAIEAAIKEALKNLS